MHPWQGEFKAGPRKTFLWLSYGSGLTPNNKTPNALQENFGRQEQNFEVHYNDAVQVLAQKYEEQLEALGEEKKQKLEALYEQLVSCGEHLDTCKELMDTTHKLYQENDKVTFMKVRSFDWQDLF